MWRAALRRGSRAGRPPSRAPVVGTAAAAGAAPTRPPRPPAPSPAGLAVCRSAATSSSSSSTGGANSAGLSDAPGAGPLWGGGLGPTGFSFPGARKLERIVELPLLTTLDAARVPEVWGGFHESHATAFGDVFTEAQLQTWRARTERCPLFVIPVAAGRGYDELFVGVQGAHVLAIPLDAFMTGPASALPVVMVSTFEELRDKTGLTLVRGEVFSESFPKVEAERFWETMKRFYLSDQRNFDIVVAFNEQPDDFKWDDVLRVAGVSA